jgi:conjugative transfer region protein TrbK
MKTTSLEQLPRLAALILVVLVVAACAIRLRGDESQPVSNPSARASDPLAMKLAECRSISIEQTDLLSECRKAWAEKRRQFLGPKAPVSSSNELGGSPLFVAPKDESRLSPGPYPIPQSEKE